MNVHVIMLILLKVTSKTKCGWQTGNYIALSLLYLSIQSSVQATFTHFILCLKHFLKITHGHIEG